MLLLLKTKSFFNSSENLALKVLQETYLKKASSMMIQKEKQKTYGNAVLTQHKNTNYLYRRGTEKR